MRHPLLQVVLALAIALPGPAVAQTIEQRFERWFGPPVGQAGARSDERTRSSRSAEQARTRTAAPPAASVPVPSERPAGGAGDADGGAVEDAGDAPVPPPADAPTDPAPADEARPAAGGEPDEEAPQPIEADAIPVPTPAPDPAPAPAGNESPSEAEAAEDGAPDAAPTEDSAPEAPSEPQEPDPQEPEAEPAYVPPESARTSPEAGAPETPDFEITPSMSVEATRAIEDARECEAELEARGAVFTVGPSLSDGACGVLRPVSLTRTSSGIAIAPDTQMLCRTALAFDIWVEQAVVPAGRAELSGAVPVAIGQASTYVCRDRASESGLSEHGRGSAIDIGRFEFEDREAVSVEAQEAGSPEDRFLARIRRAACGPFMTVIGPGTDPDHADHFHLDIAARSNGSTYCR